MTIPGNVFMFLVLLLLYSWTSGTNSVERNRRFYVRNACIFVLELCIFLCIAIFTDGCLTSKNWLCYSSHCILGAFAKLRKATISFVMSVCPSAWNSSALNGRVFMKFDIWVFFESVSWKFEFHWNLTRITGTLHEDLCTFMIISRSNLVRMRNVL